MGRIASRIASRRDASAHSEAEKITGQHTAADIRRDFDKDVSQSVAEMESKLRSNVPDLKNDSAGPTVVRLRSTPDYVEMAMVRRDASDEELSVRPPAVQGNPDVAVRVQRMVLGSAITDLQVSQHFASWLAKFASAGVAKTINASFNGNEAAASSTRWSIDSNWLAFEYTDPKRQATELAAK
jgi:hypothetical protein